MKPLLTRDASGQLAITLTKADEEAIVESFSRMQLIAFKGETNAARFVLAVIAGSEHPERELTGSPWFLDPELRRASDKRLDVALDEAECIHRNPGDRLPEWRSAEDFAEGAAMLREVQRKGSPDALPSFADLQEGDWVQFAVKGGDGRAFTPGYIACKGATALDLDSGDTYGPGAVLVAFKPLRQVVEEMAKTVSPACIFTLDDRQVLLSDPRCDWLGVTAPDERTALLAAKAALEVMIARKAK